MSALSGALGRAILADAGLDSEADLRQPEHLALIAASARAENEAGDILVRAVRAARRAGVSWALIGEQLGMSRQAAQQRFGGAESDLSAPAERWLGPVTAFDELAELDAAGRAGWRSVEVGVLSHRMVQTDTQWEHRRILWRGSLAAEEAEGWSIASRAFPWIYLVRDRGIPAEGAAT